MNEGIFLTVPVVEFLPVPKGFSQTGTAYFLREPFQGLFLDAICFNVRYFSASSE